jgi:Ca2+-binding RTX toxin-like protein
MARVQIVTPFDVPAFDGFFGQVTVASSTQYVVEADGNKAEYLGSFTYPNGGIQGIITDSRVTVDGEVKFIASEVNFPAEVLAQLSGSGQLQQAYQQILSGADVIGGSSGADVIPGFAGADAIAGAAGNDQIFGNQGADTLYGNQGADFLHAGQGDDFLYGGQDNDTLNGGAGNDVLQGGRGADSFVFASSQGNDIVTDFRIEEGDQLDLQGQTYALTTAGDGSAALLLSSGGVIILQGVTQSDFSDAYVV